MIRPNIIFTHASRLNRPNPYKISMDFTETIDFSETKYMPQKEFTWIKMQDMADTFFDAFKAL